MANCGEAIDAQTQALGVSGKWQLSVFAEPPFLGNVAEVYLLDRPVTSAAMARAAGQGAASASCFLWAADHKGFHLRCFNRAGLIHCCGHGALAAAHVLHHLARTGELERTGDAFRLYMQNDVLEIVECGQGLWLKLPRLHSAAVEVPDWMANAFSPPPTQAAVAGGEQGYWVLEYDTATTLAEVLIDYRAVCDNTERAVIITQQGAPGQLPDDMQNASFDYCLRYFAPQYGADEDAVTGSAQRVLADYWAMKTGASSFRVLQCSQRGGVLLVKLRADYVAITGNLTFSSMPFRPMSMKHKQCQ